MHKLKAAILLAGLVWGAASLAVPLLPPQEPASVITAARAALERRDYEAVIKVYAPYPAEALQAASLYRLAIAHQKLGEFEKAMAMLERATTLNPNGTFASSPERLAALRQDIVSGLPAKPVAPVAAALAVSAPEAAVAPAPAAVVTTPIVTPELPPVTSAAAVVVAPAAPTQPTVVTPKQPETWNYPAYLPLLVFGGLLLLVVGVFIAHTKKNKSALATASVTEITDVTDDRKQFTAFRDQAAMLIAGFEEMGQTDVAIYLALKRLLPLIEREVGRVRPNDGGAHETLSNHEREFLKTFPKAPLKLSNTTGQQVQLMFQTPRSAA